MKLHHYRIVLKYNIVRSKFVNHIEEKGGVSAEQIMENIKLSEEEFRREFAAPRHMELLRATKKGDKIFYTLFYKKS